jgi:hypothetical protein
MDKINSRKYPFWVVNMRHPKTEGLFGERKFEWVLWMRQNLYRLHGVRQLGVGFAFQTAWERLQFVMEMGKYDYTFQLINHRAAR